MARFLFVVPPMAGHTNPTVAVAAALAERGHEPAWVGHAAAIERLLPEGAKLFDLPWEVPAEGVDGVTAEARTVRGFAALKFLWEGFLVPLARQMLPGVRRAIETLAPDVIVVDEQAIAGALAARASGLPWATFATTSAGRGQALRNLPNVLAWTERQLESLQREAGLAPVEAPEISPVLVVVFSTPALIGSIEGFPHQAHFVGPAIATRPAAPGFPWEALRPGPRVLVSLGTLNAERGGRFFEALAAALREEQFQVICVAPDELGPFPDNFLTRRWVPQLELLPRVAAVVCHAGHNTVAEALLHAVPLVVAPIKDDQPVVAEQVVGAGAGLRISFNRPSPDRIRSAVRSVMAEPHFRASAARIRASFLEAGGAARAAEQVEALLPGPAALKPRGVRRG